MNAEQIIAAAMKRRTETGLRMDWIIPEDKEIFTAYPKDEAQKQAWIASGERQGWKLIS